MFKHGSAGKTVKRIKASAQLYILLLPAFAFFLIYHYLPIYGVQIAFREYNAIGGIIGSPWVGLKHFVSFFTSPQFTTLISNTLAISLSQLVFGFPLPIILALMLNEVDTPIFKKTVQNITYIPHFVSIVVLCGMVRVFLSQRGIINQILNLLTGSTTDFLSSSSAYRWYYIISGLWQETGWNSIIYIAALAGIDAEILEASKIDGASRLQKVVYINIPSIFPTIVILLILQCGKIMGVGYEKSYLLQNATNLSVSEIISTYVYKRGLLNSQYSFSAAVGLFDSVINLILLITVNSISKKLGETSLW